MKRALKEFADSELGEQLTLLTRQYFYSGQILSKISEKSKTKIIQRLYHEILDLPNNENPFLKLRELLVGYAFAFAQLQVLCLKEDEKTEVYYGDSEFISGELYHHIQKCAERVDELKELKWKDSTISDEELMDYCNGRCSILLFYLNGLNCVRKEFDDFDSEKDWFRPFIQAMLIWQEDTFRRDIGIDPLLADSMEGLKYSTFANLVQNGFKNPYYEWEKSWVEINDA